MARGVTPLGLPYKPQSMNLRRLLTPVLPLLLLALPSTVQAKTRPATSAAKPERARPALWKVADEDTTIWLFGTIHILPPGIDWYAGPVASALQSSDTLVTEVVEVDSPATAAETARIALANPPRNLREGLPADTRRAYETALGTLRLPASIFDANDPWYAAVALSTLPVMKDGFGAVNGAEALLGAKAKALGLKQAGLETAEGQLKLFDSLPHDTQVAYLAEVIESLPKVRQEIGDMVDAWKAGKADRLATLMNEDESDPTLMKVLLVDRNKAWARWIGERLKQPGTVFMAVGAGHLAGKDSVQAQLAAGRIRVKRVR